MAHQIEGKYAFFASSTPAWHGIGEVLKDAPSIDKAWKLAYPHELFKVDLSPTIEDENTGKRQYDAPIASHKAIIRDDGKLIGVVGSRYELVQPYDAFKFFEPWIESGLVELEAGGSLKDGSRMWALAKIKGAEAEVAKGDPVKPYFLVATAFDGSMPHCLDNTGVRVVCANTLAMAIGNNGRSANFRIRHTKSINDKIAAVRTTVEKSIRGFNEQLEIFRALAKKQMKTVQMESYVRNVMTFDMTDEEKQEELSTQKKNQINTVIDLIDAQKGLELVPAIRGTAWQAYNAVSEYITHEAGRTEDSRVDSQWFGNGAKLNQTALQLAMQA